MENLEELNNEQLRLKCLEYGMVNIPITSTTRKVLISKLQKIMNGEKPKPEKRRETIHVTKPALKEDHQVNADTKPTKINEDVPPSNRRATIGSAPPPNNIPTRRSGRMTPTIKEKTVLLPKPIAIVEIGESDEDVLVPVTDKRKSRSPSLGKSDTATTSYKHVVHQNNIKEIAEEIEYSDDPEVMTYTSTTKSDIRKATPEKLDKYSGDKEDGLMNTRRTTVNYYDSTYRSPKANITTYKGYELPDSEIYNRKTSSSLSKYMTNATDDNNEDTDDILANIETPYLSDFARRLSRLKAEPLDGSIKRTMPIHDNYYRTSESVKRVQKDESIWGAFKILVRSFMHKYRWIIRIILLLMILIFVYVFFYTN